MTTLITAAKETSKPPTFLFCIKYRSAASCAHSLGPYCHDLGPILPSTARANSVSKGRFTRCDFCRMRQAHDRPTTRLMIGVYVRKMSLHFKTCSKTLRQS